MGLLIAVLLGAVVGGGARALLPGHVPRRADVATMLAAVGAALGVLTGAITGAPWAKRISPGTFVASVLGAGLILAMFALLPRSMPSLVRGLPGRSSPPDR